MSELGSRRHPIFIWVSFPRGRGKFWTLEYSTRSELPDEDFPFLLSTGRVLYHWHGGTLSRNSKLDEIWPEATLEIHPQDAAELGLSTGDWAAVRSRRGEINLRVLLSERSPQGVVFIPFHFVEAAANILTLDRVDPQEVKMLKLKSLITILVLRVLELNLSTKAIYLTYIPQM